MCGCVLSENAFACENARWSFANVMLHLRLAQGCFVDCTRTGSLLQWFLQLTFDFSDTFDIHEDEYTNALLGRHLATRSWWAADALVDWMDSKLIAVADPTTQYSNTRMWKRTVVIRNPDSSPRAWHCVSLFQPKTATIKDIAIALVKMYLVAA